MKVLLLHLSDVHIKTTDDPILGRAKQIVDAVRNLDHDLAGAIVILSGDIAYSGREDQYLLAADFFSKMSKDLGAAFPSTKIAFLAVPGNHDCDVRENTSARETLLTAAKDNIATLAESSVADVCLSPQLQFFRFTKTLDHLNPEPGSADHRVYAEYVFSARGESIRFFCCNTAIASEKHDKQGSLLFPFDCIRGKKSSPARVCVGILHHPFHWLTQACGRETRSRLEASADIILTGHEHMLDSAKREAHGANNTYLEGGVLQENGNPENSSFSVVLVDTAELKQRVIGFKWADDYYRAINCDDPAQYHFWEAFVQNRLRLKGTFVIDQDFANSLNDPELALQHPIKGELQLSDVYIYPDLKRVNLAAEKTTRIVKGNEVPDFVDQTACLFIAGDDGAGKTSLAKTLFKTLREKGNVPILIDASKIAYNGRNCEELIERAFKQIYDPDSLTAYRQMEKAKRVLMVDNYHRLPLSAKAKSDLLKQLRQHAYRVLIFAHDLEITFRDVGEASAAKPGESAFAYYSILPLSLSRRQSLIQKWLELGGSSHDTLRFTQNLERLMRMIDTLVDKNYAPAYPAYILSVLQATEVGTEIDLHASTHGYLYELFIKTAIARVTTPLTFNVLSAYLAQIAAWMFRHDRADMSEVELKTLHAELHYQYEVLPDFDRHSKQLLDMQLVAHRNDTYTFRHPYIRYYFLAVHLRDNLSSADVREAVQRLSDEIYREEAANTLLFLSYLSKDKFILEVLLKAAAQKYPSLEEASLAADVEFLNKIDSSESRIEVPEASTPESRSDHIERLDEGRAAEADITVSKRDQLEDERTFLGKLNGALKTLQVLGQFLKNFPANLDRTEKDRIIAACTSLGRRTTTEFLRVVSNNETELLEDMILIIGRRRPGADETKVRERAIAAVVGLCEMAALGIVWRVSNALGSGDLRLTYDRVFPAHQEPMMRLIYVALQLEHYSEFPENLVFREVKDLQDNTFAYRVLRGLVVRYLALYPLDFRLRQRLGVKLQLDFQKSTKPRTEQQLIGEG